MIEPSGYSENLGPYVDVARNIFNKHKNLLKWNDEPESIMDLGMGDGRVTKEIFLPNIPQNIKEYVGCDISLDMLISSKKVIGHSHFQTFQMDATVETVPAEMRGRFHHIFSNYLFHHIPNTR